MSDKAELVRELNGALMNSMGQHFQIRADFVREIIAALESPSETAAIQTAPAEGLTREQIITSAAGLLEAHAEVVHRSNTNSCGEFEDEPEAEIEYTACMDTAKALRSLAPQASKISIEFARGILAADNASGEGFYTRACVSVAKELLRIAKASDGP
jgi:hypothetical protein